MFSLSEWFNVKKEIVMAPGEDFETVGERQGLEELAVSLR